MLLELAHSSLQGFLFIFPLKASLEPYSELFVIRLSQSYGMITQCHNNLETTKILLNC